MSTTSNPYRGFRYPAEIINQAVWLYHCFSLSLREVELILAARGIVVSYEVIRAWSRRFGRTYAKRLKRRRPQPGDKWFLDEVLVRIRGKLHYLWRAVDQHGNVLAVLVQSRRNTKAARRFFRKLLKGLCYVDVSQIWSRDAKTSEAPSQVQAASRSNCSASDGCRFWAHFACPLRIMCTISMPPRIARALSMDLNPSIGRTRRLIAR
jgi:transposase-like protein